MPFKSIRSRLLAALIASALLVIVIGIAFTYALVRDHLVEAFDHFLEDKLEYHQISAVQIDQRISFRISQPVWERIHDPEHPEFFQFRYLDGRDVYRSYGMDDEGAGLPRVGLEGDAMEGSDCVLPSGEPGRCMGLVFVPEQGDTAGEPVELHLVVAHGRDELDRTLARLRFLLLFAGLAATALASFVTVMIVRRELRPLAALSTQIDAMPVGGDGERFAWKHAPTEVAPVIDRLNELLGRAEGAIEHERQFTSNAAHELRNPLAGLRSQLELALSSDRNAEADDVTLARALRIQQQMEGLVDNLLALARLDASREEVEQGSVEPAAALRRCWKPFFETAAERKLTVRWDLDRAPQSFATAPALFDILASNLFDNATGYAPIGGEIEIVAETTDGGLRLQVSNSNPGVSEDQLPALFRRFGRGDASAAGGRDHVGIGLNLCEKITGRLDGKLKGSVDEVWFRVEAVLPPLLPLG